MKWICCKCQRVYDHYPSNSWCDTCGNEDDFDEISVDEVEEMLGGKK